MAIREAVSIQQPRDWRGSFQTALRVHRNSKWPTGHSEGVQISFQWPFCALLFSGRDTPGSNLNSYHELMIWQVIPPSHPPRLLPMCNTAVTATLTEDDGAVAKMTA